MYRCHYTSVVDLEANHVPLPWTKKKDERTGQKPTIYNNTKREVEGRAEYWMKMDFWKL